MLAFGGARTWHRMVCAIEDAGFEIRDSIAWLYGQGFPKSLDVSKAIDQAGGASPAEQARVLREARQRAGLTREQVASAVGCTPTSVRNWEDGRARSVGAAVEHILPSPQYRAVLADLLGYSADERAVVGVSADRRGDGTVMGLGHSGVSYGGPATDAARRWQGWGTALKPGHEPICVARKPLAGTVAANVLAYGTGALNIDGCRVAHASEVDRHESEAKNRHADFRSGPRTSQVYGADARDRGANGNYDGAAGRWPTNVVLSHQPLLDDDGEIIGDACADGCVPGCPIAELDAQSGHSSSRASSRGLRHGAVCGNGKGPTGPDTVRGHADAGGASRFFPTFRYEAKAGTDERPRNDDGTGHATVKPLDLIRWCARLITPPGGVLLDQFAGSGTTVEAAILEGFRGVAVELDEEGNHIPLIVQRVARARRRLQPGVARLGKAKPPPADQLDLFDLAEGGAA